MAGFVLLIGNHLLEEQIRASSSVTSKRTLQVLESFIESRRKLLSQGISFLADRPGTRELGQTDSVTVNDHLSSIRSTVGADWLAFCSPDGELLGMSSSLMRNGSHPGRKLGIDAALAGQPWEGAFVQDGHLFLAAARPIFIGSYIKGVLIGAKEVDKPFVAEIARAGSAEVSVLYEGQKIASTFDSTPSNAGDGLLRSIVHGEPYIGREAIVDSIRLASPIRLQALVPLEQISGPYEQLRNGVLLGFLGAAIAAILLGSSLSRMVTHPVELLVKAARSVQEGDWPSPFRSSRNDELGYLLNAFDHMTAGLRSNNERLLRLLDVDPLTQIWNHRSFKEKLEAALVSARDNGESLSLLMVDIDAFDEFNRSHSTDAADAVLREVADVLETCVSEAVCSRHGGDQFLVLLPGDQAEFVAESIRDSVSKRCPITVSIGIAYLGPDNGRSDLLILAAGLAKDMAKQSGRNRVRTFQGFAARDLNELRQFLQGGSYAAIKALAEAVDAKDEYTRGHSTRVAEYAQGIAETLGLDDGFVELVYTTGTLHDVGKIGVPDSILKKAEKLTDEEFEEIKKHPALGEKIVGQLPTLNDVLPGVRHHHERWDGKGYPDGLSGEEIPLLARILAVADTYDAMTSDRPYRKGMPVETAVRLLREGSGSQFDPNLVEPLVKWLSNTGTMQAA